MTTELERLVDELAYGPRDINGSIAPARAALLAYVREIERERDQAMAVLNKLHPDVKFSFVRDVAPESKP